MYSANAGRIPGWAGTVMKSYAAGTRCSRLPETASHRSSLRREGTTAARVPAAGGLEGDLIDQANADAESELQIRLHQTDTRLLRAMDEALTRISQGTFGMC